MMSLAYDRLNHSSDSRSRTCQASVCVCQEQSCEHCHKCIAGLRRSSLMSLRWLLLLIRKSVEAINGFLRAICIRLHAYDSASDIL